MNFLKVIITLAVVFISSAIDARPRGIKVIPDGSVFNNGKFQVNPNFPAIGGDYPFINQLKNSANWTLMDNSALPSPTSLTSDGYPIPGGDAMSHGGVYTLIRTADVASQGNVRIIRTTGKGTVYFPIATVATVNASSVTTGAITTINFSGTPTYSFRAGMEVPISGVSGITPSLTSTVYTVCSTGLTATSFNLCIGDATTTLSTTGTPSGTATISYGRLAVGVPVDGRVVVTYSGSPQAINFGISATDATFPISDLALMVPAEEARWDACTVAGKSCFNIDYLNTLIAAKPAVIRNLNVMNSNASIEGNWEDRKPATYFSFGSQQFKASLYAGVLTSSSAGVSTGNDYQLTFGSGAPVDRQKILFRFPADAITVTDSSVTGLPARITWTNHNMVVGQPFNFFYAFSGGALPLASPVLQAGPTNYFVESVVDANTITFSATKGGAAISTTSTGTSLFAHQTTVIASLSASSGSPNITWTGHTLNVNDPVAFTTPPAPLVAVGKYYVKTIVDPNTITVSETIGGANVTMTANSGGSFQGVREVTLNLNGTGAIPIRSQELNGVGMGRSSIPQYALGGRTILYGALTYDGATGLWAKTGADVSLGSQFLVNFWPPEIFLELCKQVGAHPWYVAPVYTLDSMTDYMPSLAVMVRDNKAVWQIPNFETNNEIWNNLFFATQYGTSHADYYVKNAGWTTGGLYNYVGKTASVLGQAMNVVFGGPIDGTKYHATVGLKTGDFLSLSSTTTVAPRVSAADYVTQSTAAQSPLSGSWGTITFVKQAANTWLTHVSIAQYFNQAYYNNSESARLGALYKGGRIQRATIDAVGNGTGVAGNILNVLQFTFGSGTLDIGTVISGPGIPLGTTITAMSPTGTLTGTGALGTYQISNSVLFSSSADAASAQPINFVPSTSDATAIQAFVDSSIWGASFTGTISGSQLTVSSVASGVIFPGLFGSGNYVFGSGVAAETTINSQASGTTGGAGVYNLRSTHATISTPTAMTTSAATGLPNLAMVYGKVSTFANSYTNKDGFQLRINGYEGGYSPDVISLAQAGDQMYVQGKFVSSTPTYPAKGLEQIVIDNCTNYHNAGGEYCSLFQFTGLGASGDDWSALTDLYVPGGSAYWNGYKNLP